MARFKAGDVYTDDVKAVWVLIIEVGCRRDDEEPLYQFTGYCDDFGRAYSDGEMTEEQINKWLKSGLWHYQCNINSLIFKQ